MASRIHYQDHTVALTDDAVILKGFTKILGRSRKVALSGVASFRMRDHAEFPSGQLPNWGVDDEGVWYTRDRRRFRRHLSIELTFTNGERIGFTPAHAARFRDLLIAHHIKEHASES
jgi:hypothetical protein